MASNYVDKDRLRQKKILIIVCSIAAILILVYICARAAWYAADADADPFSFANPAFFRLYRAYFSARFALTS